MEKEPKVVIVVLNYNGQKCLEQTIKSLLDLCYQKKEILIVDNDSKDNSFNLVKELFPECHFLKLPYNGGFAYGMNRGINWALSNGADFIWLFNYDAIAEKTSLEKLVLGYKSLNKEALLSPCILDEKKKVWFEGGRINFWNMRVEHKENRKSASEIYRTDFLTGCALFLPRIAIEKIGLLDEDFFLYYEDADYSLRALNKGFGLYIVSSAEVIHKEESIYNPKKTYHLVFSGLLFFKKHSKGFFSLYQAIYVILRRLKNQLDIKMSKSSAREVGQAYQDFYGKTTPTFFNNLRKLQ